MQEQFNFRCGICGGTCLGYGDFVLGVVLLSRIMCSGLWRCKILKYDFEVVHFSKIRNI